MAQRYDRFAWMALFAVGPWSSLADFRAGMLGLATDPASVPSATWLRRASARDGWIAARREAQADRAARVEDQALDDLAALDREHAGLGRVMRQIGAAGLERVARRRRALTPDEARLMALDGAKLERLASGGATDRIEIAVSTINVIAEAATRFHLDALRAVLDLVEREASIGPALREQAMMLAAARYGPGLDAEIARLLHAHGGRHLLPEGIEA